jgi:saccharopine dehydrogenase-like NADP-dependent oxidoreductase
MNLDGRIVVLGGYGNFGKRTCRALAKHGRGEIVIAGPSLENAEQLAEQLSTEFPRARISVAELDSRHPKFVRKLGVIAPIVVVHTAGPFQGQDYTVPEACITCRSHYVDLADARQFVHDIRTLDRHAQRRDVLLVSGASTLPGVSSAIIRRLHEGLTTISSIETSIVPAGCTARGRATIAAVLSYCGKPFRVLENGAWTTRHGWYDARLEHYPQYSRRVAVCDVPDLGLYPEYYEGVKTVTFHAGPESRAEHWALRFMAALTRAHLVRDWQRLATLFARIDSWFANGGDVGGMKLVLEGLDTAGRRARRTWNVTAIGDHGPEICCVPALVLAKKLFSGEISRRGAIPCIELIDLDDFDRETADFDIEWTIEESQEPCCTNT